MVTGASGLLGRAAIPELLERDPEVRAAVRRPEDAEPLRALGAKVTVGRLADAPLLAEVLRGVHTLVHLVGGVNQPSEDEILEANHRSTLIALGAARSAGVRRFIFVSSPGASPGAAHPFLRAKGLAEEAVSHSGLEHAILRCTHAYGVGGLWFTAAVEAAADGWVVGDGRQRIAPLLDADVAAAIAAIDDAGQEIAGTWSLSGPETLTGDAIFERLAGPGVPEHVAPPAAAGRLAAALGVAVSETTCDLFASDSLPDAPDAAVAFGIDTTPFAEGLMRTLERAGGLRGSAGDG
jgi:NADH dehydrogenase